MRHHRSPYHGGSVWQWRGTEPLEVRRETSYRKNEKVHSACAGRGTIDIRDYVNGIGNRSREPYIRARTPCYSLHPVVRRC